MKELIDAIVAIFNAAIAAETLSANSVYKGLANIPDEPAIDVFPYIALDDNGERTEITSTQSQTRIYSIVIEFATFSYNVDDNFDKCVDLSDEIKALLEAEANRQKDGYRWGVQIEPFEGAGDEDSGMKYYFKGRSVIVEYEEVEQRYFNF